MAKLDKLLKAGKKAAKETVTRAKKEVPELRVKLDKLKPKKSSSENYKKFRRGLTGRSGLKKGTEEALAKGALGLMGGAMGTGLTSSFIIQEKAAKERFRKSQEKFRKMKKFAREAESEGEKTFTYEGKKYKLDPQYYTPMIGGDVSTYFVPVETKSKKPVKKAGGGIAKCARAGKKVAEAVERRAKAANRKKDKAKEAEKKNREGKRSKLVDKMLEKDLRLGLGAGTLLALTGIVGSKKEKERLKKEEERIKKFREKNSKPKNKTPVKKARGGMVTRWESKWG